jgi:putative ABC transport system permease protein
VRGIYKSFGQGLNINPDDSVFVQLSAGEQITHSETYTGLIVIASSPKTVTTVESELTTAFGQDVRVTAVTSLLSTIESAEAGASTLLEAVAATSVVVAFIGIVTTMFTTVMERTTEIGLLKALGESSRGILFSFIAEASITGFLGGVIGAGVGVVLSFFVISALSGTLRLPGVGGFGGGPAAAASAVARGGTASFGRASVAASSSASTLKITPAISPEIIILAVLIATVIGTLGGLMPAWRASRLTPVEALRRS